MFNLGGGLGVRHNLEDARAGADDVRAASLLAAPTRRSWTGAGRG